MNKSNKGVPLLLLLFIMVTSFIAVTLALGADLPKLAGITVKDVRPNGCVDCHVKDTSMPAKLKNVEKHPPVEKIVKVVPDGCNMCHKEGSKTGSLNMVTHKQHFSNPNTNEFITNYKGDCLSCHVLDMNTFEMKVKSGPANW
jgi:hypothetical protein